MKYPLALGIDLGTSGIRINVIDASKTLLVEESIATANHTLPQEWWEDCQQLTGSITENIKREIRTIAIDGTSSTVFLCNQLGEPTSPVLWYNDQRASDQAFQIAVFSPEDSAAQGATSGLSKLLWLLDNNYSGDLITHQADWIRACFTGNYYRSDENNALKMGYDPVARCWPDWLLSDDHLASLLPVVDIPGQYSETIHGDISHELGLNKSCRITAGTTDSTAAFIASGAIEVGDAVTSLGSTLVLKLLASSPIYSAQHGIYSHRLYDRWLIGGASNSGGAVLKYYFSDDEIRSYSEKLNPDDKTGLGYYPLLEPGERFPYPDSELQPRISPIPEDRTVFFQALLEGIANIEKTGYRKLEELCGIYPKRVFSMGGGASNSGWTTIRQQLLQTEMVESQSTQAAFGSAILALNHLLGIKKEQPEA